jgi:hypothetical protein
MPDFTPDRFDAVLGGQNAPARDAVVLGGLAGAESRLAHELRSNSQRIGEAWKLPLPVDPAQERDIEPTPSLLNRLTARGRSDFDRDLNSVRTNRIVRNFPWDKTGRIALKTAVLLNTYRYGIDLETD